MTFEQFAAIVADWRARLTPEQAAMAQESLARGFVELPQGEALEAALTVTWAAMAARPDPTPVVVSRFAGNPSPSETRQWVRALERRATSAHPQPKQARPLQRARTLVRRELKHGPKPGIEIEAAARNAEIPGAALIADALGVVTRRGEWRPS